MPAEFTGSVSKVTINGVSTTAAPLEINFDSDSEASVRTALTADDLTGKTLTLEIDASSEAAKLLLGLPPEATPAVPAKSKKINGFFTAIIVAGLVFELLSDEDAGTELPFSDEDALSWHRNVLRIGRVLLVKPTSDGLHDGPSGQALQPLYREMPVKPSSVTPDSTTWAESPSATMHGLFASVFGVDIPESQWTSFSTTVAATPSSTELDDNGNPALDRVACKWTRTFVSSAVFDEIGEHKTPDGWEVCKPDAREIVAGRWTDPYG
jgi:hypothetical protein